MMAGETDCTAEPRRVEWKMQRKRYLDYSGNGSGIGSIVADSTGQS